MIHLITGGVRSGKSSHAQKLALELAENPVYVATAQRWDDSDFEDRVIRHIEERGDRWTTFEKEKRLFELPLEGRVAVVDCVTLWLTNYFMEFDNDLEKTLTTFIEDMDRLASIRQVDLFIVTNEIGMGVHAETPVGRKFADLQGWANQHIAQLADEVTLMVAGLPMTVKSKSQ